jgi:hypothetical protein
VSHPAVHGAAVFPETLSNLEVTVDLTASSPSAFSPLLRSTVSLAYVFSFVMRSCPLMGATKKALGCSQTCQPKNT